MYKMLVNFCIGNFLEGFSNAKIMAYKNWYTTQMSEIEDEGKKLFMMFSLWVYKDIFNSNYQTVLTETELDFAFHPSLLYFTNIRQLCLGKILYLVC